MIAELPVSKMQELRQPLKLTGIVVRVPDNPLESVTGTGARAAATSRPAIRSTPKQNRDRTSVIAGRITFHA
jgi:hypothetical protein